MCFPETPDSFETSTCQEENPKHFSLISLIPMSSRAHCWKGAWSLGLIILKSVNHERRNSQALWCMINLKPGPLTASELLKSWIWVKCNANDHIQVLLESSRTLSTSRSSRCCPCFFLEEKKNYHLSGMVISPSHIQPLTPFHRFVPISPPKAI